MEKSIGYDITYSNKKERKTNVNIGETSFIQNYHIVKLKGSGINNIFKDNLKNIIFLVINIFLMNIYTIQ